MSDEEEKSSEAKEAPSGKSSKGLVVVVLAAEVPPEAPKEDVENLMPRGREAAIGFLRALTYEEATSPGSFEKIKTELAKKIVEAVGEKRVAAIILTDFVVQ